MRPTKNNGSSFNKNTAALAEYSVAAICDIVSILHGGFYATISSV